MTDQIDIRDLYLLLGERDVVILRLQQQNAALLQQLAALTPQKDTTDGE